MKRVVMFSGGITSWAAAHVIIQAHGTDDVVLLFADTRVEHPDVYRFLDDAAEQLGVEVTRVADGRTPQQVNVDHRWLSNTRLAKCSHVLKQAPCRRWLEANTSPDETTVVVGIDWTEQERLTAMTRHWAPWPVDAPLCRPPYRDKRDWLDTARALGLDPPSMYRRGWAHANCAGACVRGGQAQWAHLLRENPALFASWERHEADMRAQLDSEVSILRDRTGGVTRPLPLTVLRERATEAPSLLDDLDWGGCGCFTDTRVAEPDEEQEQG